MPGVRPRSPTDNPLPCWAPQPEGPKPAKRQRLHDCTCPGSQAQPDREAPTRPASEQLTSTLFLPASLALKLHLEGGDLLLEREPDSVRRVALPGHTIILVPEDLQDSHQPGQPGFLPSSQQEAALLEMPQDHQVSLQQGSSSPSASDTQGWGNASDPQEDTQGGLGDFLRPMPWMNAPSEPDWDMSVTLPGHTILVPEDLQDSTETAQPGLWAASQLEAALLELPLDHQVSLQRGSSSKTIFDTQHWGNASDPHEDSQGGLGDFLRPRPWMKAPAGMVPVMPLPLPGVSSPLFPGQVSRPWRPSAPPGAERYAPSSIWSLKGSMLWPLPSSPLQPLPPSPSPPPRHQAQDPQSHQKIWCPCCKARRRLF